MWYSLSNFFIPFLVLLFCYCQMCVALYTNFKNKKDQQHAQQHPMMRPEDAEAAAAAAADVAQIVMDHNGSLDKKVGSTVQDKTGVN